MWLVGSHILRARAAVLLAGLLALVLAHGVQADKVARDAKATSIDDKAPLTLTGGSGTTLIEEGNATGTLPGRAQVRLTITTTIAKSTFTLYPRGGSIAGSGTLHVHPGKRSNTYESFSGSISVHHGTGRYARASGSGNIYGVLNRKTDNAEVQVIGTLYD